MKLVLSTLALLPVASALRPRRLQESSFPPCNICGEGGVITNPDAVLLLGTFGQALGMTLDTPEVTEDKTCAEFDIDGENGLISETECDLLPFVTATVCDCQFPSEAIAPVLPQDKCSCSPRDFTFQLQLDRNCDADTISGTPGIDKTVCNFRGASDDVDLSTLEIVDIQFLEFGGSGLEVINQNDTYTNTSLVDGGIFSFPSISNMLSAGMPLAEQLQYLPTGITLTMEGKAKDYDGQEVTIRNQVAWTYTESCTDLPISVGQGIGWIDVAGKDPPSPDFCTLSTTTEPTTPGTTTTEGTVTATTTTTEAIVTTSTPSNSMATTVPMFGKSAKSKSLKDPMAKVAKEITDAKAMKVSAKSAKTATNKSKRAKMSKLGSSMSV